MFAFTISSITSTNNDANEDTNFSFSDNSNSPIVSSTPCTTSCIKVFVLDVSLCSLSENFYNYKQCESSKINTFIHEVVHGVLNTMGENKLSSDEKFVTTFASLLVDVIEEIVKVNKEE